MAGADVIGAAICITLLVLVSYVVVGSIMTTAGVVSNTQNDMALSQEQRAGTSINIIEANHRPSSHRFDFQIQNTGNQIINYTKLEVIVTWDSDAPVFYKNGNGYSRTWYCLSITPDTTNPTYLDPGEVLVGRIYDGMDVPPDGFGVVTPNGIIDSTTEIT
jgi:archaellum component FlaG (FlaF/FlaG flagellin family)